MDPITCRNIRIGRQVTLDRHGNTPDVIPEVINHSSNPELPKKSSMFCDKKQSGNPLLTETPSSNNSLQYLIESCTGISSTLASPSISTCDELLAIMNNQSLPTATSVEVPHSNLSDYAAMSNTSTAASSSWNTSRVWNQSSVQRLQAHGPSKRHINDSSQSNNCTFPLSSGKDFQGHHAQSANIPDLQSPLAEQQKTISQTSSCPRSTSYYSLFGPNEFNLTISLSPLDAASVVNIEWAYVDRTGIEHTLNLNTSSLLEHLHGTSGMVNSAIRMRLPETGREYEICLKEMRMTDVNTGEKIALVRKTWMPDDMQPLQTGTQDFPLLWTPQANDIELVTLDKKGGEYSKIKGLFLRSMPESCVVSVQRIQNKKLFIRYAFQRAVLLDKNSGEEQSLNEKLLFHGTSCTPPSKIWQSEDGFDLRYCRKGMWGIGSYFAEKASYSDQYAYKYKENLVQLREMLVASVLTGNSKRLPSNKNSAQLTRPPVCTPATENNPEILYDSVNGYTRDSRIYVLYKLDMAYPSYLVRYFKLEN